MKAGSKPDTLEGSYMCNVGHPPKVCHEQGTTSGNYGTIMCPHPGCLNRCHQQECNNPIAESVQCPLTKPHDWHTKSAKKCGWLWNKDCKKCCKYPPKEAESGVTAEGGALGSTQSGVQGGKGYKRKTKSRRKPKSRRSTLRRSSRRGKIPRKKTGTRERRRLVKSKRRYRNNN
jgi:hypothetical protein